MTAQPELSLARIGADPTLRMADQTLGTAHFGNVDVAGARYSGEDAVSESPLGRLWDIEGVTGNNEFDVYYDPALIAPAELDEKIRAVAVSALPTTEHRE